MYNFEYLDQVITDIQDAKIWYKAQKEGLDIQFSFAVEKAIEKVLKMPTSLSYVTKIHALHSQKYFLITFIFILITLIKRLFSQQLCTIKDTQISP